MKMREDRKTPCWRRDTEVRRQEKRFTPAIIWMLVILYSWNVNSGSIQEGFGSGREKKIPDPDPTFKKRNHFPLSDFFHIFLPETFHDTKS